MPEDAGVDRVVDGGELSPLCRGECGGAPCESVAYEVVEQRAPACDGRGAANAFRAEAHGNAQARLVTAAPLDREACDEYVLRLRVHNGGGESFANATVRVLDVNDALVERVYRLDGGPMERVATSGGDVVVLEGADLGPVAPHADVALRGWYETEAGETLEAASCVPHLRSMGVW